MKLSLKNIGPFKDTSLNISDVTIIAGINDTGKSYLNKILFSVMKMLCINIESDLFENFLKLTKDVSLVLQKEIELNENSFSKILARRSKELQKEFELLYNELRELVILLDDKNVLNVSQKLEFSEINESELKQFLKNYLTFLNQNQQKIESITAKIKYFSERKIQNINVKYHINELSGILNGITKNFDKIKEEINLILKKEDSYIYSLISNNIFNENFDNESIKNKNYLLEESSLILSSSDSEIINILINNQNDGNKIKLNKDLNIYDDITYIDDTFAIFNSTVISKELKRRNNLESLFFTRFLLKHDVSNIFKFKSCYFQTDFESKIQNENENALNEILLKDELKSKFQNYFSLNYKINKNNDSFINEKGASIKFFNSSKGLKIIESFNKLIDTNIFAKNSMLIIDEPEAFLHPEWQYFFIKWLLDISSSIKNFKLIISTHSPYVIDIINSLSKRQFKDLNFSFNFLYKNDKSKDSYIKNEDFPQEINDALNYPYIRLEDEEFEWKYKE